MVMELEADRMTNLVLTEKQIAPEKQVVLEERRQRVANDPGAILGEYADAVMFLNHPYGRPVIGWEHEIEGLSADEVLAFYRQWYAPNNAIAVVAGDVSAAEVRPLVERYYGSIPRAETPAHTTLKEPPAETPRRAVFSDPRVRQDVWKRAYIAPSVGYGDSGQTEPLEVLAHIMGGGSSSRLYRKLVVEDGLADQAAVWYEPDMRGPAKFVIAVQPRAGVALATIEQAVDGLLGEIAANGVSDDDVARARQRLQAEAVFARDSLSGGAQVLGRALAIGLPVEHVETWPARIGAVSRDQVNVAARAVLDLRGSVTSELRAAAADQQAAR